MASQAHFYGGQAVLEGVMMRGRDHWAVAVRRPDETIHVESHTIHSIGDRVRILRKPFLRGVIALGQALTIGLRALTISANQSVEEENQLTTGQMAMSMTLAFVVFTAVFIVGPFIGFRLLREPFVGRPAQPPRRARARAAVPGVHRADRATQGDPPRLPVPRRRAQDDRGLRARRAAGARGGRQVLDAPRSLRHQLPVDRDGAGDPRLRVFPAKGLLWGILSRVIAIPIIAGISFELLRLGARFTDSKVMRALMTPGLWLQKITTKPPDHAQIEVAIASFQEVLRAEAEAPEGGATPPGTRATEPT